MESSSSNLFDTNKIATNIRNTTHKIHSINNDIYSWVFSGLSIYMRIAIYIIYPQLLIFFKSFECNCPQVKRAITDINKFILVQYILYIAFNIDYIIELPKKIASRAAIYKYISESAPSSNNGATAINIYLLSILHTDILSNILLNDDIILYIFKSIILLLFFIFHIGIIIIYFSRYMPRLSRCGCSKNTTTSTVIFVLLNMIGLGITIALPYVMPIISSIISK
jgi:hypothetical protein